MEKVINGVTITLKVFGDAFGWKYLLFIGHIES